ncbi:MAG: hypothetical protein JNL07_11675 [Rhodospirillales bacterium]|nr:hypothetical protein [Rhodospirillales bacterium]
MSGSNWSPEVPALTSISPPTGIPAGVKTCARMAEPDVSPPLWLPSAHVTTKLPLARTTTRASAWFDAVVVLTRKSGAAALPLASQTMARIDVPLPSLAASVQTTT